MTGFDINAICLGLLAWDISDALAKNDGTPDAGPDDIEPNLPAFLAAIQATSEGQPAATSAARTVQVRVQNNYGTDVVYPDCDTARVFTRLTGTKTFAYHDLDAIRALGYEITIAQESPRLPDGYGHATVI